LEDLKKKYYSNGKGGKRGRAFFTETVVLEKEKQKGRGLGTKEGYFLVWRYEGWLSVETKVLSPPIRLPG